MSPRTLPRLPARLPARVLRPALAFVVVAAALVAWNLRTDEKPLVVTADFGDTTGLYVGNDVEYLGVPVGEITRIDPQGTTVEVEMELDPDTELPADAGAVILQSALVTDRYVELGPAYSGEGELLADGAHLDDDHTRSPATIDEITASVDALVQALDSTTPGGKDVGDLIGVAADNLDGNGAAIRSALSKSRRALRAINARGEDVSGVTADLADLVDALADRDTTIRRFASSVTRSTRVVAQQRRSLSQTLRSLARMTRIVTRFVRDNHEVIGSDLDKALATVKVVDGRRSSLAESFDVMPTLAENFARAYDWRLGRLRVQFSFRVGPFSAVFRDQFCRQIGGELCRLLFRPDGSGLLDPVLDGLYGVLPKDIP